MVEAVNGWTKGQQGGSFFAIQEGTHHEYVIFIIIIHERTLFGSVLDIMIPPQRLEMIIYL